MPEVKIQRMRGPQALRNNLITKTCFMDVYAQSQTKFDYIIFFIKMCDVKSGTFIL